MNCAQIEADVVAENYVLGRLSEADRLAYEDHYFHCPDCFAELQNWQSMDAQLRRLPREVSLMPRAWWKTWAPVAAVLLLAAGLGWRFLVPPTESPVARKAAVAPQTSDRPQSNQAQLELLAKADPPAWRDSVLRGVPNSAETAFRDAMKFYAAKDYAAAGVKLDAAAKLPGATLPGATSAPAFYAAICRLELGDATDAAQRLSAVIAKGDSPWLEQAHLFRARALLIVGNVPEARQELKSTAALAGDFEAEAGRLLAALPQ